MRLALERFEALSDIFGSSFTTPSYECGRVQLAQGGLIGGSGANREFQIRAVKVEQGVNAGRVRTAVRRGSGQEGFLVCWLCVSRAREIHDTLSRTRLLPPYCLPRKTRAIKISW